MSTLAPAAPRVEPALVVEYCAPAVSYVTAAPVDEYIASMPAVDAAPTQVVKFFSLALGGSQHQQCRTSTCRGRHRSSSRSVALVEPAIKTVVY